MLKPLSDTCFLCGRNDSAAMLQPAGKRTVCEKLAEGRRGSPVTREIYSCADCRRAMRRVA